MRGARFVIDPSICFEDFSLVIAESFARLRRFRNASRLGYLAEIVERRPHRLAFRAGETHKRDLAAKVDWLVESGGHSEMGRAAGEAVRMQIHFEHKYRLLMEIYQRSDLRRARHKRRAVAKGNWSGF
jgi:hypothetical protein